MALICLTLGGVFSFSHTNLLSVPQTDHVFPTLATLISFLFLKQTMFFLP